jgi:HD superfamily phosphohydrolase
MHLAGRAFDQIFHHFDFVSEKTRKRLRQTVRLAALLHDVGHGPLSHASEEVMPQLSELQLKTRPDKGESNRKANHEDYTIKIVTDSPLAEVLKKNFSDIDPWRVASLIAPDLDVHDEFFMESKLDFRPVLSQIVSSELDVDRMDYLARDSYYCGTSYGEIDRDWLLANLTYHVHKDQVYMGLQHKALYTFDDFLISRHHMFLMVYFHHKAIIYDETLLKFIRSKDCDVRLPADIHEYLDWDDYKLNLLMRANPNRWAQMIARRQPFRMLVELHDQSAHLDLNALEKKLIGEGVETIRSSSKSRLSKYYSGEGATRGEPIYVIDGEGTRHTTATPIEESTEIFARYQKARRIDRIYVDPKQWTKAQRLL